MTAARRAPAARGPCLLSVGLLLAVALLGRAVPAGAHDLPADGRPAALREVGFDQRVNEPAPLDLVFQDEGGRPVRLGAYFGQRPVILALVYYHCQNLCPLVLDGLVRTARAMGLDAGRQYQIVAVSFDPRDLPAIAAARKADILQRYGRPGAEAGWHFLTGEEAAIRRLARAAGFRYAYDAATEQYAHAAGLVVLTPRGRIFRYLSGIDYSPRDLRLSLVEAAANRVGSPIDQLLLFCYHYDPTAGRYTLLVMNIIRLAGAATVGALAAFLLVMRRRDRRGAVPAAEKA